MDTDVLVVGAGPTGLMLANQLQRRGVRSLIIDRHAGPARETRALGVQARTLEIYAQLGVLERALELGKPGIGANIWASGRHMGQVALGAAGSGDTPYPFIFVLGQDDNERLLGEHLAAQGLTVAWNTELVDLEQEPAQVRVRLKGPDGTMRETCASWVAGCDGAHSAVRQLSGISFPGAPYEHVFFVADTEMTGSMVADQVNVYLWRAGFHLLFPMRGTDHWRVVGIVPEQLRDTPDLTFDAVTPSIRHEAGASMTFWSCSWFSTYRIHHRAAARFRSGRCFVLGDAAHVHSPAGAQGMNTGLQDAYNLAWKLALVVSGRAGAGLLDSYEAERLPVARALLNSTDRAFRLVVSDNPLAGILRTQVLARLAAFAMSRPRIQRWVFRVISQIGIRYRGSPLSQSLGALPRGAPRAGDRFPWMHLRLGADAPPQDVFRVFRDSHFNLLLAGQGVTPELAGLDGLLRVHVATDDAHNEREFARVGIPRRAFYLLRPDGHVGLCGTQLPPGAVTGYLSGRLGLRP